MGEVFTHYNPGLTKPEMTMAELKKTIEQIQYVLPEPYPVEVQFGEDAERRMIEQVISNLPEGFALSRCPFNGIPHRENKMLIRGTAMVRMSDETLAMIDCRTEEEKDKDHASYNHEEAN